MVPKVVVFAVGAAALLFGSAAAAWDRIVVDNPAPAAADFAPAQISASDATGFWAVGTAGYFSSTSAIVRYDAGGTPLFVRHPSTALNWTSAGAVVALADGGFVTGYASGNFVDSFFTSYCFLQRYDAGGTFRWQSYYGYSTAGNLACSISPAIDGEGGLWQPTDVGIARRGADGAAGPSITLPGYGFSIVDSTSSAVYYVGADVAPDRITKYSAAGTVLWQQPSVAGVTIVRAGTAADGTLYAFGYVGDAYDLYAISIASSGGLRWEKTYPGLAAEFFDDLAVAADGSSYVSVEPGVTGGLRLYKIGPDGSLAWPNAFMPAPGGCVFVQSSLSLTPRQDVLYFYEPSMYCDQDPALIRLKPDATQVFRHVVKRTYDYWSASPVVRAQADDSALIVTSPGGFVHIGASGTDLATPVTTQIIDGAYSISDRALAPDGSGYFITQEDDTHYTLSHFSSDGTLLWRQAGSGYLYLGNASSLLTAGDRVCVVGSFGATRLNAAVNEHVSCRAAADGQLLADTSLTYNTSAGQYASTLAARLLADGQMAVVYVPGAALSTHFALISAEGVVRRDIVLQSGYGRASINASGQTAIIPYDASGKIAISAYAQDGTALYRSVHLATIAVQQQVGVTMNDDGTALVSAAASASDGRFALYMMLIENDGTQRWISPALAPASDQFATYCCGATVVTGTHVFVATLPSKEVFSLSLATGAVEREIALPPASEFANYVDTHLTQNVNGDRLLITTSYADRVRLSLLDVTSGALQYDRFESCMVELCWSSAVAVGDDGAFRLLADTYGSDLGDRERIYVVDHPFAVAGSIRLDQAGISGAWYPPYSAGQGFTLDYIAAAQTIFMPWFTFAPDTDPSGLYGLEDQTELAWFGLQGSVTPGATAADLTIAVTDPGAFNSGTATGHTVGSAHLSLIDCNNATLYYQFNADSNGETGGVIALTRLTPNTAPCVLADGSTVAAQNANPPASGFDARQSGSWYDPATSGQGLEMTIIPAGGDSNGLVFAAWFTFDPVGTSDDTIHQHWFTLQGDLANATNGKVTLPIYRIIGGSFDGAPTQNFSQVGHAILTMQGCDTAQLDYQFDTTDVAHAFAGLTGTSHLTKIGGCTAQ